MLLALAFGAAATVALPPLNFVPLLVVALGGLLWLIDGARDWRRAMVLGWCFGTGFFGAGLWWIGQAFQVDADRFGALALPAIVGLSAGLALFIAVAAGLARLAAAGVPRAVALALAWAAMEWLRGHVLTGFPWNLLASAWAPVDAMQQGAALFGAYGLSLLTALVAILPATLDRRAVAVASVVLVVAWGGGALRLAGAEVAMVDGVRLRLVQAGISQRDKWRGNLALRHLALQLDLSRSAADPPPTHIIWPEAAIAFFLDERPDVRRAMAEVIPAGGLLITGMVRRTWSETDQVRLWNSVAAIDGTGAVTAVYDKAHLVPFGEYMPLRSVIDLDNLTQGGLDFSPGADRATWALPGLPPLGPLVCYEVIFPGGVVGTGDRPAWLLNVTNDAWFGDSAGPRQHLAAARLRSIEEGMPLVRAAGGGISAVVDPYGRIVASLDLGRKGVLDSGLPAALVAAPPYARIGDLALIPLVVLALPWVFRRSRTGG
ncbi:MAG: apolipoprotein N-acyltransferase [Alphaproteobacteria bacterium]|nr:apolipoprotein N-acyltransferase [Alphaproteobacteria bacterium]